MTEPIIRIDKYTPELKHTWNDFVESSKNGTFLFNRAYMDYHSDRFNDFSLMIYRKDKLYCLLPANIKDDMVYSHQGLTYGGLIMSDKCSAEGILEVFESLLDLFKKHDIKKFIYKPVPHIYHKLPSEEDLYALFRHNASLLVRNISSCIDLSHSLPLYHDRKTAINRAKRNNISVSLTDDFPSFWKILEDNLWETYRSRPVHSLHEMSALASDFPGEIKLYGAFMEGRMVAGTVCYSTPTTLHAQYISATPSGKKAGAVDALIEHIKKNCIQKEEVKKYFDLGTSNEDGGKVLNETLIYQKQGFGGRGIAYDTYEIKL